MTFEYLVVQLVHLQGEALVLFEQLSCLHVLAVLVYTTGFLVACIVDLSPVIVLVVQKRALR